MWKKWIFLVLDFVQDAPCTEGIARSNAFVLFFPRNPGHSGLVRTVPCFLRWFFTFRYCYWNRPVLIKKPKISQYELPTRRTEVLALNTPFFLKNHPNRKTSVSRHLLILKVPCFFSFFSLFGLFFDITFCFGTILSTNAWLWSTFSTNRRLNRGKKAPRTKL